MVLYKIRNKEGLFSVGGTATHFDETGKAWKRKGDVANHLHVVQRVRKYGHGYDYTDCEVVVFELVEIGTLPISPEEWLLSNKKKKEAEKQEMLARGHAESKKKRMELYEQLKDEFGG